MCFFPQDKEKQAAGWKKWDAINDTLTVTLRTTAEEACKLGKITEKQQHEFFMSGTCEGYKGKDGVHN